MTIFTSKHIVTLARGGVGLQYQVLSPCIILATNLRPSPCRFHMFLHHLICIPFRYRQRIGRNKYSTSLHEDTDILDKNPTSTKKPIPSKKPTPPKKPEKPTNQLQLRSLRSLFLLRNLLHPKKPTPFDLKDKKAAGIELSGNEDKKDEVDEQYYENTAFIGE